jgi:Na+-translocating ferredoxin:NAD+ oxidoreductase subunit A
MQPDSLTFIFLNAFLINNFVLALFLGLCPFLGVSAKVQTAWNMGLAVIFVMFVSSNCAYFINKILVHYDLEFLRLIAYIAVIASSVQLVEMTIKKFSPALFRTLGIFLPLITTNCAILGLALFQTNRAYDWAQCLAFSAGAGDGFTLAFVLASAPAPAPASPSHWS